jgi:hypothetical protein
MARFGWLAALGFFTMVRARLVAALPAVPGDVAEDGVGSARKHRHAAAPARADAVQGAAAAGGAKSGRYPTAIPTRYCTAMRTVLINHAIHSTAIPALPTDLYYSRALATGGLPPCGRHIATAPTVALLCEHAASQFR